MRLQKIINMRKHARKAVCELQCLLEECDEDISESDYQMLNQKINDFEKWLFEESPIA